MKPPSLTVWLLNLKHVYRETKFIFPEGRPISFAKRIIVVIWCLPFLHRASLWLKAENNPLLAREFSSLSEIREFLFRPYINRYWSTVKRLNVIEQHYRLVCSNASILNLMPDEYIDLIEFDLTQGKLRVVLDRPSWVRREGEIGLSLFLGIDRIYTVMFLLLGTSANMKLVIGCVQGVEIDQGKNLYKNLTRTLHGMRPRDFLLHLLKMISEELHCNEILGISDVAHRSNIWYSRAFKHASYDTMWLEHGGTKTNDGFFSLAPRHIKRSEMNLTARKRALYRRRYQFLDDIQESLRRAVLSPPAKKQHRHGKVQLQQ